MTSCIVRKKVRAMGPGPLELFPFVVLAIKFCIFLNNFYTGFQILMKFVLHIHLYATPGIRSMQWGYIVFVFSVCLSVCLSVCQSVSLLTFIFVSKISQELLYLET